MATLIVFIVALVGILFLIAQRFFEIRQNRRFFISQYLLRFDPLIMRLVIDARRFVRSFRSLIWHLPETTKNTSENFLYSALIKLQGRIQNRELKKNGESSEYFKKIQEGLEQDNREG